MIIETKGKPTILIPNDRFALTNGNVTSYKVYLGKSDSADNWHEITVEEAEQLMEE